MRWTCLFLPCLFCLVALVAVTIESRVSQLIDPELQRDELKRVEQYHKRNYTFPLDRYVPNNAGWGILMEDRFHQIEEIDDRAQRYEAFIQTLHSALIVPNFTEYGFGLARCPDKLLGDLQRAIREGIPNAREEAINPAIRGPKRPLFIQHDDLTRRVLSELQPLTEAWSGIELTPYQAYGFRLYRNESSLYMHLDKMETHVVSFILHIDSSDDAEPWPLFIEDFYGRTHEVILSPGDVLLYESSKCMHGRPRPFKGSWYTSVFSHYYPTRGWSERNRVYDSHCAVPPLWVLEPPAERRHQRLEMVGTAMFEPHCPDGWCRTERSVIWSGPAEKGAMISPASAMGPFHREIEIEFRMESKSDQ